MHPHAAPKNDSNSRISHKGLETTFGLDKKVSVFGLMDPASTKAPVISNWHYHPYDAVSHYTAKQPICLDQSPTGEAGEGVVGVITY